jgi:hypothetical protein
VVAVSSVRGKSVKRHAWVKRKRQVCGPPGRRQEAGGDEARGRGGGRSVVKRKRQVCGPLGCHCW